MRNHLFRVRALERLYQIALRIVREDEAKSLVDLDLDHEARAKKFVASMSGSTQTLLVYHIQERHGRDAFDEFAWLMPGMQAIAFTMDADLQRGGSVRVQPPTSGKIVRKPITRDPRTFFPPM